MTTVLISQKQKSLTGMRMKPATEKEITAQIRHYLKLKGIFHWKNWAGLGSSRGVADILGSYQGKLLAIEVKTARGRISDDQQAFIDRVNQEGGLAFVARSLDDVMKRIE